MSIENLLMHIDINLIAFLMLIFIWFVAVRRQDKNDLLNRLFMYMIFTTAADLLIEACSFAVDGQQGNFAMSLNYILNMLLFSIGPLLMILWSIFVDYWLFNDKKRLKNKSVVFSIPVIFNFILVFSSPVNGYVFTISDTNTYQRGPLFFASIGIAYFFMAYSMILVIINHRHIKEDEFLPLLLFALPTAIAGSLQALQYGLLLMWSSAAFSLIILYIYLQQRMNQVDTLTGVWTRGTLDRYLDRRITRSSKTGGFAAIMIDLDNFKKINDTFGHTEGDVALKNTSRILKSALRKEDIVARYGGDEFVILLEMITDKDVENVLDRIKLCFENWNAAIPNRKYLLAYSSGYALYEHDSIMTMNEFLFRVDSLMYTSKFERKKSMQFG